MKMLKTTRGASSLFFSALTLENYAQVPNVVPCMVRFCAHLHRTYFSSCPFAIFSRMAFLRATVLMQLVPLSAFVFAGNPIKPRPLKPEPKSEPKTEPKTEPEPQTMPEPSTSESASASLLLPQPMGFSAWLKSFGLGAVTVTAVRTATAPLERAKVLCQLQTEHPGAHRFSGVFATLRHIVATDGARGLWFGNGANVLRSIPVHGMKLSLNDVIKSWVAPGELHPSMAKLILAGSIAAMMQVLATLPLDVLRVRKTVGNSLDFKMQHRGLWHCARHIVTTEGFFALYKGLTPTLVSGVPFVALQMTLFSELSRRAPRNADGTRSLLWMMPAGACAGVVAQTLTYPGDTVRKLMMVDGVGGAPRAYSGMVDCCRKIAARHGWRGFYAGLWPNTMRAVPEVALQMTLYEMLKRKAGLSHA